MRWYTVYHHESTCEQEKWWSDDYSKLWFTFCPNTVTSLWTTTFIWDMLEGKKKKTDCPPLLFAHFFGGFLDICWPRVDLVFQRCPAVGSIRSQFGTVHQHTKDYERHQGCTSLFLNLDDWLIKNEDMPAPPKLYNDWFIALSPLHMPRICPVWSIFRTLQWHIQYK